MIIYNKNGEQILDALVTDNCERQNTLMGENYVLLSFVSQTSYKFLTDSYIEYNNERFYLLSDYQGLSVQGEIRYDLKFYAEEAKFEKPLFYYVPTNGIPQYYFRFTGNLNDAAALLVDCIKREFPGREWKIGGVKPNTELKDLSFNGLSIRAALDYVSQQFDTEWWRLGDLLNLIKCEMGDEILIDDGSMLSSSSQPERKDIPPSKIYAYGGTKNIKGKFDGTVNYGNRLQLPDNTPYISVPGVFTGKEEIKIFDEIYPRIEGRITDVKFNGDAEDPVYYVSDSKMGFDPFEVLIPEVSARIHFTSGRLNGRDFDVEFTFIEQLGVKTYWMEIFREVQEDVFLPRPGFEPRVGDGYTILNINLPANKEEEARQELLVKTTEYALDRANSVDPITCEANKYLFARDSLLFNVGQRIRFIRSDFRDGYISSRVTEIRYSLNAPWDFRFTLAQTVKPSRVGSFEASLYSLVASAENMKEEDRYYHPLGGNFNIPFKASTIHAKEVNSPDIKTDNIGTTDFVSGLLGNGFNLDKYGNIEARNITAWESLSVPELIYNRVSINVGNSWQTNGGGIIEKVDMLTDQTGIITLRLEDGEYGAVAVDDFCMGIWHNLDPSDNNTETTDDGKGNFTFAGFGTSYFRITEILDTVHNSQFSFTLRPISASYKKQSIPKAGMHFAQFANPSNKNRQSSVYSTTTYTRALQDMTTWEHSFANIAAQLYDCSNLSVFGRNDLAKKSMYITNIYMSGTIQQFEDKPLSMNIDFSLGSFMAPNETGTITVKILNGYGVDVTNTMTQWIWTRESGDILGDQAWNTAHRNTRDALDITYEDLGNNENSNISTLFLVWASDDALREVKGQIEL